MVEAKLISCPTCDTQYDTAKLCHCPACGNRPIPPQKPKPHPRWFTCSQCGAEYKTENGQCPLCYINGNTDTIPTICCTLCGEIYKWIEDECPGCGEPNESPTLSEETLKANLDTLMDLLADSGYGQEEPRQFQAKPDPAHSSETRTSVFTKLKRKLNPFKKSLPKRSKQSSELRAIIGLLDATTLRFGNYLVFERIKTMIESAIAWDPNQITKTIRSGERGSPEVIIYTWIANIAGDFAESGQYHLWRGTLNPMTGGSDLPTIFDTAMLELVRLGHIELEYANEQMAALRNNIKLVG